MATFAAPSTGALPPVPADIVTGSLAWLVIRFVIMVKYGELRRAFASLYYGPPRPMRAVDFAVVAASLALPLWAMAIWAPSVPVWFIDAFGLVSAVALWIQGRKDGQAAGAYAAVAVALAALLAGIVAARR